MDTYPVDKFLKICVFEKRLSRINCFEHYTSGRKPTSNSTIFQQVPWVITHARWMSKVIYTFRITLFKAQLHELHVIDGNAL